MVSKSKIRAIVFLLVLVALAAAIQFSGWSEYLDQGRLQTWISGFGATGQLVYIMIFVTAPALFLPGLPITLAGGLAFGPMWGTIYASVGSTLGAGAAFLIARYFARGAIQNLLGERWKKIDKGVAQRGWVYVAITRLVPIFPFNLLNYAFGLTKIPFWVYLLTSWVCMFPATAAYVVFSSSLLGLLKGKVSGTFLAGLILIVIVSLMPMVYRNRREAKNP